MILDKIFKPIDSIAYWLRDGLGAQAQLRIGVLCVLLSVPVLIFGFFTNEPFMVYQMSALALTLTGVGIVVGAQVLVQSEEAEGEASRAANNTHKCSKCGK